MAFRQAGPLGVGHDDHHAKVAKHLARHGHHAHQGHHGPQEHPAVPHAAGSQPESQLESQPDESVRTFLELHPLPGGLTANLLRQAMRGVSASAATTWVTSLNAACTKYDITRSLRRMAAFLGHTAHESGGLRKLTENLNYKDAHKINDLFRAIKTDEEGQGYVHEPEALANKAYANRNGNGDEASGDGWRYRGRGLIQLTGKANYAAFGKEIDVDVVKDPELVATPKYAALSAASYWKRRGLNELADAERYQALSLKINSKLKSFPEREAKRKHALDALCHAVMAELTVSIVQGGFGGLF